MKARNSEYKQRLFGERKSTAFLPPLVPGLACFLALIFAHPTLGQAATPPAPAPLNWTPLTLPEAGFQRAALTAELGWLQLGEDHFLGLSLETVLDLGLFRAGIHAPLNLRVIDGDPESDEVVREEDWDEKSDWFRILRFVEIGKPHRGPIYARFGELAGSSLGHGTMMDYYYNNILLDHYQAGISMRLDLGPVGGEVLLDNVADPEIFGMRGFARPFRFMEGNDGLFEQLAVGMTMVTDTKAPYAIRKEGVTHITPAVSDTENLLTDDRRATFFLGIDVELRLVDTREFRIEPYVDINSHLANGSGTHWGILNRWDPTDDFQLTLRTEYRLLGEGYMPSYFNAIYEVERFQFYFFDPTTDDSTNAPHATDTNTFPGTKLQFAKNHATSSANGGLVEFGAVVYRALHLRARYQGSGRPNDDELWLQVGLPYLGSLQVSGIYLKRRAEGFEDLFNLDQGLLTAEIRYKFLGPLAVKALVSREWRVEEDNIYETTTTWQFGAIADFSF